MINKGQTNIQEIKIQGLIDRYLQFRSANANFSSNGNHLDEDHLTAFVEGRISERESPSIINHLIDCSFCLHVTGELAKLNMIFAEEEAVIPVSAKEPMKVSEVLNGLLSRIFGTSDNAVFAHQEQEKEGSKEDDSEEPEKHS